MINFFFAGGAERRDKHILKKKACRLYSFANELKSIERFCKHEERGPLMVDSGAYSVAFSGKKVDLNNYIKFINDNPQIEYFIQLDDIPYTAMGTKSIKDCQEASWENYKYMVKQLDNPCKLLPVFHYGEELSHLERILDFRIDGKPIPNICVGTKRGTPEKQRELRYQRAFAVIEQSSNPAVKVHALGMTVLSTLEKFPFYSTDSTSYKQQAIYGSIFTKYGCINVSERNNYKDNYKHLSKAEQEKIREYIESMGYNMEVLATDYKSRVEFNIDFTLDWLENLEYKGPKSFVTNNNHVKKLF